MDASTTAAIMAGLAGLNGAVLGLLVGVLVAIQFQSSRGNSRDNCRQYHQVLYLKSPRDIDTVIFPWLKRRWSVVLTMHDERIGEHVVVLERERSATARRAR